MWSQDLRQGLDDYRGQGRLREKDSICAATACYHHAGADLRITHALELCLKTIGSPEETDGIKFWFITDTLEGKRVGVYVDIA